MKNSNLMIEDQSYKMSPKAKRAKQSLLSEDKENEALDYSVPIFTGRYVHFHFVWYLISDILLTNYKNNKYINLSLHSWILW